MFLKSSLLFFFSGRVSPSPGFTSASSLTPLLVSISSGASSLNFTSGPNAASPEMFRKITSSLREKKKKKMLSRINVRMKKRGNGWCYGEEERQGWVALFD